MALPLFIFAATLCRFIGDEDWLPEERTAVLQTEATTSTSDMDRTDFEIGATVTCLVCSGYLLILAVGNSVISWALIDEDKQIRMSRHPLSATSF
jgi:high-affinity nickel permease